MYKFVNYIFLHTVVIRSGFLPDKHLSEALSIYKKTIS